MKYSLLVISSHPDDEAICSGGLIMLAKKLGWNVFVLYMATGTSRQFTNGQTLEDQRINEAKNAANYGNFNYRIAFNGISTNVDTFPQKKMIEMIEDTVKEFKPDIVVIPNRDSYSQDHRAVAEASVSAFRPIPQNFHHQPKMVLEVEEPTTWPVGFSPNYFFDITDVMDEKLGLYQCHTSQVTEDPQYRSCANLRRLAALRGTEIGVAYAEAYKLLKGQML